MLKIYFELDNNGNFTTREDWGDDKPTEIFNNPFYCKKIKEQISLFLKKYGELPKKDISDSCFNGLDFTSIKESDGSIILVKRINPNHPSLDKDKLKLSKLKLKSKSKLKLLKLKTILNTLYTRDRVFKNNI